MEELNNYYFSFFREVSKMYDKAGGFRNLAALLKYRNASGSDTNSIRFNLAHSILSYFLSVNNTNKNGDRRLFAISDLHIKILVHQCEKAELFLFNNPH